MGGKNSQVALMGRFLSVKETRESEREREKTSDHVLFTVSWGCVFFSFSFIFKASTVAAARTSLERTYEGEKNHYRCILNAQMTLHVPHKVSWQPGGFDQAAEIRLWLKSETNLLVSSVRHQDPVSTCVNMFWRMCVCFLSETCIYTKFCSNPSFFFLYRNNLTPLNLTI